MPRCAVLQAGGPTPRHPVRQGAGVERHMQLQLLVQDEPTRDAVCSSRVVWAARSRPCRAWSTNCVQGVSVTVRPSRLCFGGVSWRLCLPLLVQCALGCIIYSTHEVPAAADCSSRARAPVCIAVLSYRHVEKSLSCLLLLVPIRTVM